MCVLTRVSASRKTHFSNCTRRQQWSFVKVTPNSGRLSSAKLAASCESSTFTSCTTLYTSFSLSRIASDTVGVTSTASWWAVPARFSECASTKAPSEYVSFVVSVTQANSVKGAGEGEEGQGLANTQRVLLILQLRFRAWDRHRNRYTQIQIQLQLQVQQQQQLGHSASFSFSLSLSIFIFSLAFGKFAE